MPLFIALSHACYAQKDNDLAIAFYNCENFFASRHEPGKGNADFTPNGKFRYTEDIYQQKLRNIATVLQGIDEETSSGVAIVALAEIENEQVLNDLVTRTELKERDFHFICLDTPDKNGLNLAFLYDPGKFIVLYSENIPVSYNKVPLRNILYINGLLAGDTIHIFINQWASERRGEQNSDLKRMASAKAYRNKIDSIFKIKPAANIILFGDFSTNPTDSALLTGLKTQAEKYSRDPYVLYNPWMGIYKSGRGSLEYLDHWDLYDQIIFFELIPYVKIQIAFSESRHFQKRLYGRS